MRTTFSLILLFLILFSGCKKEEPTHSLQYEVRTYQNNSAVFYIHFLDPGSATVSTGKIDTLVWQSTRYANVKEGTKLRIEAEVEQGIPQFDLIIRKDNSIVARKKIRSSQSGYILEDEM